MLRDIASHRRIFLLPYGSVSIKKHQNNARIAINTLRETRIQYFRYILDPRLRKIRGPDWLANNQEFKTLMLSHQTEAAKGRGGDDDGDSGAVAAVAGGKYKCCEREVQVLRVGV